MGELGKTIGFRLGVLGDRSPARGNCRTRPTEPEFPFWPHQEVYTHLTLLEPLRASFYFPLNPLRLGPFKDGHSALFRGPKTGTCLLSGWLHRHLVLPASFAVV